MTIHCSFTRRIHYLRRWMPFEEICAKPCSTGRDKDCKEIVRAIDSGGQNAHEGPCRSVVQRKLRRKQSRGAQRGNEREKMWCAMLLILLSTITISVSFNRSSTRTLKFILILSLTKLFNHGN